MATVPAPITWVTGQIVTAAQLNSNVRDSVNFLITPPLAIMYQTITQSVANNVWVSMLLDTETIDRDGGHSTTTNTSRYTAQTAGWYDCDAYAVFATNTSGMRGCRLAVNGSPVQGRAQFAAPVPGTQITGVSASGMVFLNVGDYVESQGTQGSGGSLNTSDNADLAPSLQVRWCST